MPWQTPTLKEVRSNVRDHIRGSLPGADASVPNSVLRVLSDAQGGLCHLTLQYIDWLALQLLPDTAEHEWLQRHGEIWLVNSDGTLGRKNATFAFGSASFTGFVGTVVPAFTRLEGSNPGLADNVSYETTTVITIGSEPTPAPIRALDPGTIGNLESGRPLSLLSTVPGADNVATVIELTGGVDTENDDDLRMRVLKRIRQPPQGGAKHDYEQWALAVPGVTRAWCAPLEMGMGTVTLRFMMDELRADLDGFPTEFDVATVTNYIDIMRPVAVKDMFVVAPLPQRVDAYIQRLIPDNPAIRAAIEQNLIDMLREFAAPGQTIYAAWKSVAIMDTAGVESFHLMSYDDDIMPSPGHLAVLGDIVFV